VKRYDPKGEAMAVVNLRAKEVGKLGELLTVTDDVRQLTRAQALLWLDAGDSVEEVAERLGVTRQAVYNWGHVLPPGPRWGGSRGWPMDRAVVAPARRLGLLILCWNK
jgi:hypothetical protein